MAHLLEDQVLLHDSDTSLRVRRIKGGRYELQEYKEDPPLPGQLVPKGSWSTILSTHDFGDAFDIMDRRAKNKAADRRVPLYPPQTLRGCLDKAWKKAAQHVLAGIVIG